MRVAIVSHGVTDQALLGGPGHVAAEHAKALAARGHQVAVVTTDLVWKGTRATNPTFQLVEAPDVSVHCARAHSASWWPGSLGPIVTTGMRSLLEDVVGRVDIVHAHEWPHHVVQSARAVAHRHGKGFVVQPHGSIQVRSNGWRRAMHAGFNVTHGVTARDNFIALTRQEAHEITTVLRRKPTLYRLPNPMPPARLSADDPRVSARRSSWGCPPGARLLVYAHRIAPNKGLDIAIRALALLPADFHLIVVGEVTGYPSYAEECRALATELGLEGRVRFFRAVPRREVEEVILAGDIFILPARRDTYPLMILHALACGRPAVVTRTCQSVEDVAGAVALADADPCSFADAITALSPRVVASLVSAGRDLINRRFSPDQVAVRLEDIYADVLAGMTSSA